MTEIFVKTHSPDKGDVIELPEEATTAVERVGEVEIGLPRLVITVVGRGERSEYVVLRNDADGELTVPDGSYVLGIDSWNETIYYAVPRSAWGGSE